ncbi:MAG: hypothetical protein HFH80_00295 [Lachnospiraceae bacterium]|nr:hypothetical protein [Lachnospiraceae bacterium]
MMNRKKIVAAFATVALMAILIIILCKHYIDGIHSNVLEQIIAGNFTSIGELNEEQIKELVWVYNRCQEMNNTQWIYADINNDGILELIWQEKNVAGNSQMHRILAIFTASNEGTKRIIWDTADTGEFYFMNNNKIIYYYSYSGTYDYDYYGVCECEPEGELKVYKFFEVYNTNGLTEMELMDFLSQFDRSQEVSKFDYGEEDVYYVIGTCLTDEKNSKILIKKDKWIEQFRNDIGFISLEGD